MQFGQAPSEADKFRPAALILREMKEAYEKECMRAYRYFAENVTRFFSTYKNTNKYILRAIYASEIEAKNIVDVNAIFSFLIL